MVQARLNGFLPPDFDPALMPLIDLANPRRKPAPADFGPIEIEMARSLKRAGLAKRSGLPT